MFSAVCTECGRNCEVPFEPTGNKPVLCNACFRGNDSQDYNRRDYDRREKQMFDAVCDECGKNCRLPFRPTGNKPVLCSECFEMQEKGQSIQKKFTKPQPDYSQEFKSLHDKLDRITKLLEGKIAPPMTVKAVPAKSKSIAALAKKQNAKTVKIVKKKSVSKKKKPAEKKD